MDNRRKQQALDHGRTGLADEQVVPRHERGISAEAAAGGAVASA